MGYQQQFEKDRDKALLSLNKAKISRFIRKYGIQFYPRNDLVFWASVHKAILGLDGAAPAQKERSARWLIMNGFKPEAVKIISSM